ncbi:lasso peptide biosynthesis B2 protein [Paenibacillus cymbidii]|uniref:lasso peptide biosynthesis B2 protein n=1 Tax=Paenibacillus cymbidii TaxID=1639034 RepID=UPI0010807096|nr:lasso peptide biosynthesis B2 protein [Paenibacillus cymbidii]
MLYKIEAYFTYLYLRRHLENKDYSKIKYFFDSDGQRTYKYDCCDSKTEKIAEAVSNVVGKIVKSNECLYKSGIGLIMLRRRKYKVNIKIGIQFPPFRSHAWLEVGTDQKLFGEGSEKYTVIK